MRGGAGGGGGLIVNAPRGKNLRFTHTMLGYSICSTISLPLGTVVHTSVAFLYLCRNCGTHECGVPLPL